MEKYVIKQEHHHVKEKTFQVSVNSLILQASWKRKSAPQTLTFGNVAQKNIFPLVIISELGRLMHLWCTSQQGINTPYFHSTFALTYKPGKVKQDY